MSFVKVHTQDGIATVVLDRGKVNALNLSVVNELHDCFTAMAADEDTRAVVLTGAGKFFSFGFDVPEFLSFSKGEFTAFLTRFTDLYTCIFRYPKPVIAALNGHTVAGGCMLAIACDHRIMAAGKGKIALNEITFGASVFAGSAEMLRFLVGSANATAILYSGGMYGPDEALGLGLVQEVVPPADLMDRAETVARDLAAKPAAAFAGIKSLLRGPVADEMRKREKTSIADFVEIWYTETTRAYLEDIKIR